MQTAGVPGTEALPGGARESHHERRVGHAVVAVAPRDFTRHPRADGAMIVSNFVAELAAARGLDGRQAVFHHALGELALVERLVAGHAAELRRLGRYAAIGDEGREIEMLLA